MRPTFTSSVRSSERALLAGGSSPAFGSADFSQAALRKNGGLATVFLPSFIMTLPTSRWKSTKTYR